MNTLGLILNSIHIFFVFIPFLIFVIPKLWLQKVFQIYYVSLLNNTTSWIYFDDSCIFTLFTKIW